MKFFSDMIQFGTARSGSTLCFNAMKLIAPEAQIRKAHMIKFHYRWLPMVATVRDPFDSVMSLLTRNQRTIDDENVREFSTRLYGLGFHVLHKVQPSALILRYEDFYQDLDGLLEEVGGYLRIKPTEEQRAAFRGDFAVSKVFESARNSAERDDRGFLPRHVSENLGKPGAGAAFSDGHRAIIRQVLRLDELKGPAGKLVRASYL